MAIRDFEKYFSEIKAQYFEMKEDLAEFNQMFKDGHITEDRLKQTIEYVDVLEENYNRLLYVETLLKKRRRTSKKQQKLDEALTKELTDKKADAESVKAENKEALDKIVKHLEALKSGKDL